MTKQEPFSPRTATTQSRLRGAEVTQSVCPYCAIGCGLLVFTKAGKLIDIEGNPESPVNEGRLCPWELCGVGALSLGGGMLIPLCLLLVVDSSLFMFGAVMFILLGSLAIRFVIVKLPHASA
jgi:hypothetical protein